MAIINIPQASTLSLKVQTGISGSGAPVFKLRNYGNMKPASTNENVYSVATSLAALQKHALIGVARQDNSSLVTE